MENQLVACVKHIHCHSVIMGGAFACLAFATKWVGSGGGFSVRPLARLDYIVATRFHCCTDVVQRDI